MAEVGLDGHAGDERRLGDFAVGQVVSRELANPESASRQAFDPGQHHAPRPLRPKKIELATRATRLRKDQGASPTPGRTDGANLAKRMEPSTAEMEHLKRIERQQ
jgi:hypothetical protein